jgi:hypothetical protein
LKAALPWIEPPVRFGAFVRGLLYLLAGMFALRLALDSGGAAMAPAGAIALIGDQEFGRILLVLVAAGLLGYATWGFFRAVFDPHGRGTRPLGMFQRAGYAVSAVGHGGLLVLTLGLLSGAGARHSSNWIGSLLAHPLGPWLLGLVGVCWIFGAGLMQILAGARGSMERDLRTERMSKRTRSFVLALGRVGAVARGLLFTLVGGFMIQAAMQRDPERCEGIEAAWLALLHEPYGRWLLGAVSLGIVAFGLYSMLCARWMRVRVL